MRAYLDFWRRWKDFLGKTKRPDFWKAFWIHIIISFLLMIFLLILLVSIPLLDVESRITVFEMLWSMYGILWIVPMLSMTVRRLHDAGYTAKSFLWLLVPALGGIALFARLCTKSADECSIT